MNLTTEFLLTLEEIAGVVAGLKSFHSQNQPHR